jgi:hypothetical protein
MARFLSAMTDMKKSEWYAALRTEFPTTRLLYKGITNGGDVSFGTL